MRDLLLPLWRDFKRERLAAFAASAIGCVKASSCRRTCPSSAAASLKSIRLHPHHPSRALFPTITLLPTMLRSTSLRLARAAAVSRPATAAAFSSTSRVAALGSHVPAASREWAGTSTAADDAHGTKLLIDGEWVASSSGKQGGYPVHDPVRIGAQCREPDADAMLLPRSDSPRTRS